MKIYFVFSSHFGHILREENCRILVSFANVKRTIDLNQYYGFIPKLPEGFPEILIDSGGYQLQTGVRTSMRISVSEYSRWLIDALDKYPEIVGYMNLDILNDPLETMNNQFRIESEGLKPVPTWHDSDPQEFLSFYCSHYEWVAIGGLVGKRALGKRYITNLCNWMHQEYPGIKFHLFGIGISGALGYQQSSPYSCDFSTWSTVSRYGHAIVNRKTDPQYFTPGDGGQLIKEIMLPLNIRKKLLATVEVIDKSWNEYNPDEPRMKNIKNIDHDLILHEQLTREAVVNIKMFENQINEKSGKEYQGLLV